MIREWEALRSLHCPISAKLPNHFSRCLSLFLLRLVRLPASLPKAIGAAWLMDTAE